jgi:hypothetical protein
MEGPRRRKATRFFLDDPPKLAGFGIGHSPRSCPEILSANRRIPCYEIRLTSGLEINRNKLSPRLSDDDVIPIDHNP